MRNCKKKSNKKYKLYYDTTSTFVEKKNRGLKHGSVTYFTNRICGCLLEIHKYTGHNITHSFSPLF